MKAFQWMRNFDTGFIEIDQQHRCLVDLINLLGDAVTEKATNSVNIEAIVEELVDYAQSHFREEEDLMAVVGIDMEHFVAHTSAHDGFLRDVLTLYETSKLKPKGDFQDLLDFLVHWLVYHILGADQDMARQIRAIESGMSPREAYGAMESERSETTEALVAALEKLFNLVSTRNQALLQLNQSLEAKVAERTQALSTANRHLEMLASTDALTGLPNRRSAMVYLAASWRRSVQEHTPLVCMMIDADGFKEVNDRFGHDAGDQVLRRFAQTLRETLRSDDFVCRLGGDEFLVICPHTDLPGGLQAAESLRSAIAALQIHFPEGMWQGSLSAGVAARTASMNSYEAIVGVADRGLYAAKQAGRDRIKTRQTSPSVA